MKKHIFAGLLAATLFAPAFAADNKFIANAPKEPLHRRTIAVSIVLLLVLSAGKIRLLKKPETPSAPGGY